MPDLPDHLPDPIDASRILSEADGPLRTDVLVDRLVAAGHDHADATDVAASVADLGGVHVLADDRVVDAWVALDGAQVSHRLTSAELDHGVLVPGADLLVLADLFDPDDGDLFLGDGIHLHEVDPAFDTDLLRLYDIPVEAVPPGGAWLLVGVSLETSNADDVIVVAVDGRQARLIGPLPGTEAGLVTHDATSAAGVASALREGWRRAGRGDGEDRDPGADQVPIPVVDLAFEILVADPWVFGPQSIPFSQSLELAGWVTNGDVVGATEADLERWELMIEATELAVFYRLDQDQALALAHLLALFDLVKDAVEREPGPGSVAGASPIGSPMPSVPSPHHIDLGEGAAVTLSWLADADVASAFVSQAIGIRVDHALALVRFAVNARACAPRAAEAATLWLEAKALARLGLALPAAERLDEAVRIDRSFVPLLLDAANLASDRGDADAAIRFARAAGLNDDDDFVRTLTDLAPPAPPGLGRNEPCFCGSGRKYKHCHLGRTELDLDQRAGWLYRKALEWIQDTPWRLRLLEIAEAYAPEEDDDAVLHLAMSEPFIADLAFSDDSAWAEFVADRGILLPADERELAARWATIGRSVYEIVAVQPGTAVEVRDVRTPGAPALTVAEHSFSIHAGLGEMILARALPAGTTPQFFGGIISLGPDEQDDVVAALDSGASGVELAGLLGGLRDGPRLTNTEGEPLIFCGATYALADPATARAALDRDPDLTRDRDRPTDGEAEGIDAFDAAWIEPIVVDGRDWIRARYTLRAHELVLEANSEARMARAHRRVETTITGAELIHEEQRPLDELADTAPFDPRTLLGSPAEVSTELQAVLDELGRAGDR